MADTRGTLGRFRASPFALRPSVAALPLGGMRCARFRLTRGCNLIRLRANRIIGGLRREGKWSMKYFAMIATLAMVAALTFLSGGGSAVMAQGASGSSGPGKPQAPAAPGSNAGEAVVTWDAVDGAKFYRVGWISIEDAVAKILDGGDWQDVFDYRSFRQRRGDVLHRYRPDARPAVRLYRGQRPSAPRQPPLVAVVGAGDVGQRSLRRRPQTPWSSCITKPAAPTGGTISTGTPTPLSEPGSAYPPTVTAA